MNRVEVERAVDEALALNAFFHGSPKPLPIGKTLKARKNPHRANALVERAVDKHRPAGASPRWQSWFMVEDPCDVERAGGSSQYVYEVLPRGGATPASFTHYKAALKAFLARAQRTGLVPTQTEVDRLVATHAKRYWKAKGGPQEWLTPRVKVMRHVRCRA